MERLMSTILSYLVPPCRASDRAVPTKSVGGPWNGVILKLPLQCEALEGGYFLCPSTKTGGHHTQ